MVAEPVDHDVPYRPVASDQQRFPERYPNVVGHQVATLEVFELEVLPVCGGGVSLHLLDRVGVLS
jgi:hypothetical protein